MVRRQVWAFSAAVSASRRLPIHGVLGAIRNAAAHLPIARAANDLVPVHIFGGEKNMKQRLLVSSIIVGLYASLAAGGVAAQSADGQPQDKKKETTELQGVVVTGSLIPRAQIETASPTITITSAEMKKQGFSNVYDALRSLPTAQGAVQDNQSTNSFTPGATTISLLGLDPSFTLVLMNGKPLADYPLLYNSQSNFVDLSSIPNAIVDHIDILPGNQSAIYGSAAIAGVVNIITKQHIDGVDLDFRVGGYSDGGGQQQRLQLSGGNKWGDLDLIYALQLDNQDPIYGYQRDYTDSNLDGPTAGSRVNSRARVFSNAFNNKYIDPGADTCAPISGLFGNSLSYSTRPGFGNYCGTPKSNAYTTFLNGNKSATGYLNARYRLNDTTQIYGDFVASVSKQKIEVGGVTFWGLGDGTAPYVYDVDTKHLVSVYQHILAPEEVGTLADPSIWGEQYVSTLGIRGSIGDSAWNYDGYFHRSDVRTGFKQRRLLTNKANAFFLGQQVGEDPFGYGYPAYHLGPKNNPNFWGAITPGQYASISDDVRNDSSTYNETAALQLNNTELFSLPAGQVGFGGIAEWGKQSWKNPIDPRVTAGEFWGTGGTSGRGTRDRWAVAGEFNVPVFSMLTADLSGRYDKYSTDANSQGKFTYRIGLEFRPFDTLLFRGNYGTAFRAPDMGYVFSGGSKFFTNVTDYYNCRKDQGDNYGTCNPPNDSVQINGSSSGNEALKYITAKSFGYGVVWSPSPNLTLKADYVHVKIDQEVNSYSINTILQREADCRLGHTTNGTPVDGNSPTCKAFEALVNRNPIDAPVGAGQLNGVKTFPINISNESVSNIIASAAYKLETGRFGDFTFLADYNLQTSHLRQQFPEDPVTDLLRGNFYGNQFKNIGSAGIVWDIGPWSTAVKYLRYGKTFNFKGTETVGPWMRYNASVQYNFSDDASLALIGNNIFNARPPRDNTFTSYPFYDLYSYNSYGRLVMLEMNVHFGGGKK